MPILLAFRPTRRARKYLVSAPRGRAFCQKIELVPNRAGGEPPVLVHFLHAEKDYSFAVAL